MYVIVAGSAGSVRGAGDTYESTQQARRIRVETNRS
jgi:hypothetical protein